ncbi:hypothetical protein EJB05_19276, partial [Eragrostis curvula]
MSTGEEALRSQYVIGDEIGRGRFGTVRRCFASTTGEPFAVKSTPKAPLREADPLDLALAEQEPKLHLLVSASPPASRHLVALHAAFEDADAVHLVLDLCAGGDLFSLSVLRGNLRFPPRAFAAVSPEAKDLMRRMLCKDVSRRFSAEQVLSKPTNSSCVYGASSTRFLPLKLFFLEETAPVDCDPRRKCGGGLNGDDPLHLQ